MTLTNYAGTRFSVSVDRTIRLLDRCRRGMLARCRRRALARLVAYESDNRITNTGPAAWRKDTGLVSIWILGMYQPGAAHDDCDPVRARV